jgi:glycosyltransferase involved in cell wall biosynthesis
MSKNKKKVEYRPFVSVCTPTYNRRPFIENMLRCFRNQDYPKNRMEWIIVDDGTDKIRDLIDKANIPQIQYFAVDKKMTLGAKRNLMHKHVKGTIIVYMDDDDYYPPDRVSHAVERLESNKTAMCAGSSEIYIYFKSLNRMVQCGPYGPNHATAGTFAFRTELLKSTQYEDHAALAEERAFLKEYTVPFVQLDPLKTILVFSHEHNTFDKRKMLDNPHPDYLKTSDKTVDTFIRRKGEEPIKDFFMNQIDKLLEGYEPGLPKMKPDVLEQIKKIEAERAEMVRKAQEEQQQYQPIILQQPGKEPVALSQQDVVNLIQQQQEGLQQQQHTMGEMQNVMQQAQAAMNQLSAENSELKNRLSSCSDHDKNAAVELSQLQELVIQIQTQLIEKTRQNKDLIATNQAELQKVRDEMGDTIKKLQAELEVERARNVVPLPNAVTNPIISVPTKTEPEVKISVNE